LVHFNAASDHNNDVYTKSIADCGQLMVDTAESSDFEEDFDIRIRKPAKKARDWIHA
jgi:hypothetical protein